jgi:hypothetical protein
MLGEGIQQHGIYFTVNVRGWGGEGNKKTCCALSLQQVAYIRTII